MLVVVLVQKILLYIPFSVEEVENWYLDLAHQKTMTFSEIVLPLDLKLLPNIFFNQLTLPGVVFMEQEGSIILF